MLYRYEIFGEGRNTTFRGISGIATSVQDDSSNRQFRISLELIDNDIPELSKAFTVKLLLGGKGSLNANSTCRLTVCFVLSSPRSIPHCP